MTTEQTITIHHEPPDTMHGRKPIIAWSILNKGWFQQSAETVKDYWGTDYTAWYDPQVGEPVKARRFVVVQFGRGDSYDVDDLSLRPGGTGIAFRIPTRAAAEAIADIYERAAEGGEA